MIVYTMAKPVADLVAGDIIVACSRALTLEREVPAMTGLRAWEYTRYEGNGEAVRSAVGSEVTLRADATIPVVCVDIRDGYAVTP